MALINYPTLHFKESFTTFLTFVEKYNRDKLLKEQLRPQHAKLFARMLIQLSRQLHNRNTLFKDAPSLRQINNKAPVVLSTNRKVLSWVESTIKINEHSVYNQLLRLMDAGVITGKNNHGTQMNFELLINPDLLKLSNKNSRGKENNKQKVTENLTSENEPDSPNESNKIKPNSLLEKEHFNNLNITVDKVNKVSQANACDGLLKEQERTKKNFLKEHGEIAQGQNQEQIDLTQKKINSWNLRAKKNKEKEQDLAPAVGSKLRDHQKAAARWFFWYVMSVLFEKREFNSAHLENTICYVENNYFVNCLSSEDLKRTQKLYKWRIDTAKRSIQRHKINMQWIFPGNYLNKNNKGTNPQTGKPFMSFANTEGWKSKYEKFKMTKQQEKNDNKNLVLLQKQISLYMKNPCIDQFRRCEAYIKKNIPDQMNAFLSHFTTTKIQANA